MDVNWSDPETFWLNVTNMALGIITLVALLFILGSVVVELYDRAKKRATAQTLDFHILHVSELGLTAADGRENSGKKGGFPSGNSIS